MKKDFILTFLTQIIILISGLAVFKLAMIQFGTTGFAEFSLVKRLSSYIYTLSALGIGVAIPRYIALEIGKKSKNEDSVFISALIILIFSMLFLGLVILILSDKITILLFNDSTYNYFLIPLFIVIIGLMLHGLIYDYYRGKMLFKYANILQLINIGIIPLAAFFVADSVPSLFLTIGYTTIIISFILLIKIISTIKIDVKQIRIYIPTILTYGLQRLPADFGLASLFALPPIFYAHTHSVIEAGYIAFSISLLSLSGQFVAPIGLIMLPKISHLVGEKNFSAIQYYVKRLFLFSLIISLSGTIIYQLYAEEILLIYLGEVKLDLITISKNIMFGTLFYPIYVAMRNIVDALHARAYNTISITSALILFVSIYFITDNIYNSLLIALATMSLMTLYFIKTLLIKVRK